MENNDTKIEKPAVDDKKMFLTTILHQLRTPLAGARWAIETAIKDKNCTNRDILTEGLNRIIYSIEIVGEILKSNSYHLNETENKLNKNNFVLNNLIRSIISKLNFLIQEKGVSISYEEDSTFEINGDERLLGFVLTNIFDNAFRYSPNGKVFVSIKKEGDFAKVIVKDNGIGIDPDDSSHIFEKFFRGRNAKIIDPNESGVGLYTTKKVVEMHGGDITISSVLNEGTTVEVSLPININKV